MGCDEDQQEESSGTLTGRMRKDEVVAVFEEIDYIQPMHN
jgi:hypothetical protein